MPIKMNECKLCKKEFEPRKGMETLSICEVCDYSGRSGVSRRQRMAFSPRDCEHVPGEILFDGGR